MASSKQGSGGPCGPINWTQECQSKAPIPLVPQGPECPKVLGESGSGWAKGPWKGRLTAPLQSARPADAAQLRQIFPRVLPGTPPCTPGPATPHAPRAAGAAARPGLPDNSHRRASEAGPRAPSGPAAHLSRGSIQLVLLVLWSM